MNELDFYNPGDDLELVELEAPKRRRKRRRNPEPIAIATTPFLLLGAGYLAWVWYNQTKTGLWSFTPWRTLGRRRLPKAPNAQQAEQRRQADLDRATEAMMAPAFSVEEIDLWRAPRHDALEKEVVSFIEP